MVRKKKDENLNNEETKEPVKRKRRTKAEIEAEKMLNESSETKSKSNSEKEVKPKTRRSTSKSESTTKSVSSTTPRVNIKKMDLTDVMGDRFGRYSKYIIQDRALPDARDGLKPVQRRILYGLFVEGNTSEKSYRKSAKGVGIVMGNYHPHGDSSIYDAMVRMSQDWKMRHVLIDMHGNNGSLDGDGAAAMRYTETRLHEFANELLRDINKNTVDMVFNFDDSDKEPSVLPASYPNLLVNGSTGISSGYATDIPPHNLREVSEAAMLLMDKPNSTLEDIMKIVKGPDFPTGAIVQGLDGIKQAYETGKGKVVIRSKYTIEEVKVGRTTFPQIVITEIPYDVIKASLLKKIDEIRVDKKVDGIVEVRDETDKNGVRIAIDLRNDVKDKVEPIINYLLKNTDLQVNYNFNMVAIVDRTPKQLGIIEMLEAYNAHRKEVVTRRLNFELEKAKKRLHIVEGLIKALGVLDELIKTIKASKNKGDAKLNIEKKFGFTPEQSEAIVSLQLYRLSNTDIKDLQNEQKELEKEIKTKEGILSSETKLKTFIKGELKELVDKYGEERRSEIQKEIEEIKVNNTELIVEEDIVLSVSRDGYIKRSSIRSVNSSGGREACGVKDGDELILVKSGKTTQKLLVFTDKGNYAYLPVNDLNDDKWKDTGTHLSNYVSAGGGESILYAELVDNVEGERYVSIIKDNGLIKRTLLKEYEVTRTNKLYEAIKNKNGEKVVYVGITEGDNEVLVYSANGYGLRFKDEEVNPKGLKTEGMRAIDLREGDKVIKAFMVSPKDVKGIESNHGELAEYPRGRKGNKVKPVKKK